MRTSILFSLLSLCKRFCTRVCAWISICFIRVKQSLETAKISSYLEQAIRNFSERVIPLTKPGIHRRVISKMEFWVCCCKQSRRRLWEVLCQKAREQGIDISRERLLSKWEVKILFKFVSHFTVLNPLTPSVLYTGHLLNKRKKEQTKEKQRESNRQRGKNGC